MVSHMARDDDTAVRSASAAPGSTSSSLLVQLKAGQPDAWQKLLDLYGPLVYYWCRKLGLQPADSSDVFQDVFSAVSANIVRFTYERGRGRFRGWLWTIARNKIRDHYRHGAAEAHGEGGTQWQRRMGEIPEQWPEPASSEEDCQQLTGLFHRGLSLVQAEFEERTWMAFWRVAIKQQEVAQVAAELGMSPAAVRQAKSRVLRRLRSVLGELLD